MGTGEDLEAADARLLAVLGEGFREAARRAGEHLVCKAGCSLCCFGPFPVTRLDVLRLRRGLALLRARDAARAAAVVERAAAARADLRDGYPGDAESGRIEADVKALDAFFELHSEMPCPVLDPREGTCDLYEHRPVACRTFGPPLQYDREQAPHCRLCFEDARPEEVEACRWRPDPERLEERILQRLQVTPGEDWERLIAYAVADQAW